VACHATVFAGDANAGVSCESCHGPGSGYLEPHQAKDSYDKSVVQYGMTKLVGNLQGWTQQCTNCHVMNDERLIKANHPSGDDFDLAKKFQPVSLHFKKMYAQVDVGSIARAELDGIIRRRRGGAAPQASPVAAAPVAAPPVAAPPVAAPSAGTPPAAVPPVAAGPVAVPPVEPVPSATTPPSQAAPAAPAPPAATPPPVRAPAAAPSALPPGRSAAAPRATARVAEPSPAPPGSPTSIEPARPLPDLAPATAAAPPATAPGTPAAPATVVVPTGESAWLSGGWWLLGVALLVAGGVFLWWRRK